MIALMSDWVRLGRYVTRARVAMGWKTATAMARDIGIGDATLRSIERAKADSYSPSTLALIEQALRWQPRSIDTILAGGEPTPMPPLEPQPDIVVQDVEGALGVQVAHVAGQLPPKALEAFLAELRRMGVIDDDEEI